MKTKISEIFSSIQGEGLYLGKRQIFVRFYGCNMRCAYCDTMPSRYEELSVGDVLNRINSCLKDRVTVSFTGGEPVVHVVYLKLLLKELKTLGLKTYLETNGTLPGALNKVI
ncbi:MAG: 7-carboxy-7-deazaguanine synthase QueE, partial [Candidatus Omnitrophica bacterium]|nr:7-carboxy-7-deazaguanine synthase QueE [Candidatus Omnitrophota bacterium]